MTYKRVIIMARGINKVILVGNVGGDPEVRCLPNGNAVTNITLATGESWKDKQTGQQQERTEWHRVVFFGRLAEIAGEYLRKGSQVYVEGSLRTRKWQGQDGQDRYTTEVVVDINGSMQLLGSRQEGADRQPATAQEAAPVASNPVAGSASKDSKEETAASYQKAKGKSPKKEKRSAYEASFVVPETETDDIPF